MRVTVTTWVGLLLSAALGLAGDKLKISKDSPLYGLPSAEGSHLAELKALGDNSWLSLGKPGADPEHGVARGRAYSPRMAYSSALRGAFYTGEGVHGWFDEASGVYQDCVWVYDVNAHRWVCVKPGTNGKTVELELNQDGFEVDLQGDLVPVAFSGHGYEFLTYDSDRHRFVFVTGAVNTYWVKCMGERRMKWLENKSQPLTWSSHPWQYDVASAKWMRQPTAGPRPKISRATTGVHYIPAKKRVFVSASGSSTWFYDTAANRWGEINTKGTQLPVKGSPVTCFDRKRERIYVLGMKAMPDLEMHYFDLKKRVWVDTELESPILTAKNQYLTGGHSLAYDSQNDVILFKRSGHSYHLFEPETNRLNSTPLELPAGYQTKYLVATAFYSPDHNAFFIHQAGDSSTNGRMWAYRYRK